MPNGKESEGLAGVLARWQEREAQGHHRQAVELEALRRALIEMERESLKLHGQTRQTLEALTREVNRVKRRLKNLATAAR